ncbi:MAG TPA: c-type cytochrome [Acidimicrobiales bacterium]
MLIAVLAACGAADPGGSVVDPAAVGDVRAGRAAIETHGCASCHNIPGISGADATVGPPLDDWAQRVYIAGALVNSPEALQRWLLDPQAVEPGTAMPDVGLSEEEAADVAAYLFSLGG